MANVGILVDDGVTLRYAYKVIAPAGSIQNSVLNLTAIGTFMDIYNKARDNADNIASTYTNGALASQQILEKTIVTYTVTFIYASGNITSKVVSKTTGGSVTVNYVYDGLGNITGILQVGGD